jgi:serine/threonine-protein kinase HipA
MLFLALSGKNGIGRISYESKKLDTGSEDPVNLDSLIHSENSGEMFNRLVEKYLLKTTAGVSGVQAKVVVPEARGTLTLPSLIVKSGNAEYPNIALNEYLCMSIAKVAGLRTPDFWITDDHQLFVMRRFDYSDANSKLGMEDFSVLTGKSSDKKYAARYESLLRAANLYDVDVSEMYTQIVLSLLVGNGDAHLKNFAILYKDVTGPYELSPVYDVVCTKAYGDETTALSINKSRNYPNKAYLIKLGNEFGVLNPNEIIERIIEAVHQVCGERADQLSAFDATFISEAIIGNMQKVAAGAAK